MDDAWSQRADLLGRFGVASLEGVGTGGAGVVTWINVQRRLPDRGRRMLASAGPCKAIVVARRGWDARQPDPTQK